jgi:hypothetical protein
MKKIKNINMLIIFLLLLIVCIGILININIKEQFVKDRVPITSNFRIHVDDNRVLQADPNSGLVSVQPLNLSYNNQKWYLTYLRDLGCYQIRCARVSSIDNPHYLVIDPATGYIYTRRYSSSDKTRWDIVFNTDDVICTSTGQKLSTLECTRPTDMIKDTITEIPVKLTMYETGKGLMLINSIINDINTTHLGLTPSNNIQMFTLKTVI